MIPKREVPGTGIVASVLVQGSVPFAHETKQESFAVLDAFWELGGNAVDLGWLYRGGACTEVVGEWMKERGNRDGLVLYTKGCHPLGEPRVRPEFVRSDLEDELRRLGADRVEFFGFHRDDPAQDVRELLEELGALREEGKVLHWACSNWEVPRIVEFNLAAEEMGLPGFAFNNPNLSLATVNEPMWSGCHTLPEEEYEWHVEKGYPLWSWSSVGSGWFAGVVSDDVTRVYDNEENRARRVRAESLGQRYGLSATQVALGWVLSRPFPTWALVGGDTPEQVRENARLFGVEISATEYESLTQ